MPASPFAATATFVREARPARERRHARVVRDVRPDRLDAAAALLRLVVPAACAGLTPYDSPKLSRFLAVATELGPGCRTVVLREISAGDHPAAVADWRVLGSVLFLNGLAVDPAHRRQGHARALLDDGIDRAGEHGCCSVELDVAADNVAALALYERLGFEPVGTSTWARLALPDRVAEPSGWRVRNWPAFVCQCDAYGFADLELDGPSGPATVRVLPGGWRLGAVAADPGGRPLGQLAGDLAAALAGIVNRPRVVFAIWDGDEPVPGSAPVASFYRMRRRLIS